MEKRIFILLIAIIFIPQIKAYPYEIEEFNVEIYLYEGKVHEKIQITLTNFESLDTFQYSFIYPLENLKIYDNLGDLDYSKENESLLIRINPQEKNYTFVIEFDTSGYISLVKEGKWVFSPIFSFSVPVKKMMVTIVIPDTMSVLSPIAPTPNMFSSYKNNLILKWEKEDVEAGEEFYVLIGYKSIKMPQNTNQYLIYGGILVIGFVFGIFFGRITKRRRERLFLDDEKIVIDEILKEGKITQSELVEKTGFSKAKVSKILSSLEEKGIVEREKYKRTNIVFLKEKF